ncbi:uncharacterized protein FIBRA_07849 [Fibroporia radiculosa]|uniref:Cytochrome b-c1 complex subunit 8 n=1 Tax=Fibroporia radiculosa TaxID=599839 RepID=J4GVQ6_9APHY|nr:uncharacterized protein FIBRA_07849 [Fibroporia radiculosa]CCM05620.1 predicted protein [Fibroporia radiculosa]
MRVTDVRRSDMPGPKVYVSVLSPVPVSELRCTVYGIIFFGNLWWGDRELPKQKGLTQYSMSPMRQRATHNLFRNWIFNGYRRLSGQMPYWIIPFAIASWSAAERLSFGYGTYSWAKRYDAYLNSKAGHIAAHGGH